MLIYSRPYPHLIIILPFTEAFVSGCAIQPSPCQVLRHSSAVSQGKTNMQKGYTLLSCLLFLVVVGRVFGRVSRTIVPFQYGWRFHYGDDPTSPPLSGPGYCSTAFETNLNDYNVCDGMERNPNRFSEKDCRLACCYDPNCMACM